MKKPVRSDYQVAQFLNDVTFIDYLNKMSNIWMSRINWNGLPVSIDRRFLEYTMLYNGSIAVFMDEVVGELTALPWSMEGEPDNQRNPVRIFAYSDTGYHRRLDRRKPGEEFVIIWDNYERTVPIDMISLYAFRLYSIQRIMDVNMENQKNPKILSAPEGQKLTIENIANKVSGNVARLFLKGNYKEQPATIDLTVPYVADKLRIELSNTWDDFLTWCGIENGNRNKRERLVQDEVNSNYGNVEASRNVSLMPRSDAANRMNMIWGTACEPEFNSNLPTSLNRPDLAEARKRGNDGTVHGDAE